MSLTYPELSRRAEEYQMNKITLKTVIEALEHASDEQEKDFLLYLNEGVESWSGIELARIIDTHIKSIEADIASEEQADKAYLPARNG